MGRDHAVEQVLQLVCRIGGAAVADNHLYDLLCQVNLAGQGTLAKRHVEQGSHLADDHGAERPFQCDPQAAGILFRCDFTALVAAGQETGGTGGQCQLMVIPEEDDISFFNCQPDPLVMGIERPGPLFQDE